MKDLLITVSGGRSSAMMAYHISNSPKYTGFNKLFAFCNTGQERPETINFLKDIVKYWKIPLFLIEGVFSKKAGMGVRHKIVDFETLSMDSKPFEGAIMHLNKNKWTGVPNTATPYCSEYLKSRVSHSLARDIFGTTKYKKAIGYRFEDMPKRITLAELREDKNRIAPLLTDFETPVSMIDLNNFYHTQPFKLNLHSSLGNCRLCWKKSDKNLIESIQFDLTNNHTSTIDWYEKMEVKYGNTFFRGKRSITELVKIAKSGIQTNLYDEYAGDGCVCNF